MKVMRTPKMDVVRFTESDVIVASGNIRTATVANAGGGSKDLTLQLINGASVHDYTYAQLIDSQGDHMLDGGISFTHGENSTTLNALIADDVNNGNFDGYYESTDDGWTYFWKHQ